MADPLILSKNPNFFYPIGNTPAVFLAQNLAPEENARVLLLGCGDPRSILFTCQCCQSTMQKLDFTCCDSEPSTLARNVLLFAIATSDIDGRNQQKLWNIMYHFFLDKESLQLLLEKCQRLVAVSKSLQTWDESEFAPFVKMCSAETLAELHKYWSHYVTMGSRTGKAKVEYEKKYRAGIARVVKEQLHDLKGDYVHACRGAGPLISATLQIIPDIYRHYWLHGVTHIQKDDINSSRLVNPTLAYASGMEGFHLHATSPLAEFHLSRALTPLKERNRPTGIPRMIGGSQDKQGDIMGAAQEEFSEWCASFRLLASTRRVIVRMFFGNAFPLCNTLWAKSLGLSSAGEYVSSFSDKELVLDDGTATPHTFNAIDTSNLIDHWGLIPVLIATTPLLSKTPSSTLYTETMGGYTTDATHGFPERLGDDLSVVLLLLNIAPVPLLSRFDSNSSTTETFLKKYIEDARYRERLAWKIPSLGDSFASNSPPKVPDHVSFDPVQLAHCLFHVYRTLFRSEDFEYVLTRGLTMHKHVENMRYLTYVRKSFAMLLRLAKIRPWKEMEWDRFTTSLLGLMEKNRKSPIIQHSYQDLLAQCHLMDVFTADSLRTKWRPDTRPFDSWDSSKIPLVVCVVLVVPREKLAVFENMKDMGTPALLCGVRSAGSGDIFASAHACFGSCKVTGSGSETRVIVERDENGWAGRSPLVLSFWVPTRLLMQDPVLVGTLLSSKYSEERLAKLLGPQKIIYETWADDSAHVVVSCERPNIQGEIEKTSAVSRYLTKDLSEVDSGVNVHLDYSCQKIKTMRKRINIVSAEEKRALISEWASVSGTQISPCTIGVEFGDHKHNFSFPFPINGFYKKIGFDKKKSPYIEVLAFPSTPKDEAGYSLWPFPIVHSPGDGSIVPFNLHRIPLSVTPALSFPTNSTLPPWVNEHISMSFSSHELSLRPKSEELLLNTTGNLLADMKHLLHTMLMSTAVLLQSGNPEIVFKLTCPKNDTNILIYVRDLVIDTVGSTIGIDVDVVPMRLGVKLAAAAATAKGPSSRPNKPLNIKQFLIGEDQFRYWKQFLEASAERCRDSSWEHSPLCEYKTKKDYNVEGDFPFCSCAKGIRAGPGGPCPPELKSEATRAIISPLFSVLWVQNVGVTPADKPPTLLLRVLLWVAKKWLLLRAKRKRTTTTTTTSTTVSQGGGGGTSSGGIDGGTKMQSRTLHSGTAFSPRAISSPGIDFHQRRRFTSCIIPPPAPRCGLARIPYRVIPGCPARSLVLPAARLTGFLVVYQASGRCAGSMGSLGIRWSRFMQR